MPRHPTTPDCEIKGCSRAAYRGSLCREHYAMVPIEMTLQCSQAVAVASFNTARKHHRQQLAYVRRALAGV